MINIGDRFGKLVVVADVPRDEWPIHGEKTPYREPLWVVRCDCGQVKRVFARNLRRAA